MSILVTGSAGHLGEAMLRQLRAQGAAALGVDIVDSPYTDHVGSIMDRGFVAEAMRGARCVLHAATLHKPHVATHSRQDFVDANITGTLNLLEEARLQGVSAFVFTSSTSVFGRALTPPIGAPAVWVSEDLAPQPKNIYGVTKLAAEEMCRLFHQKYGLPCIVLRASRFFPEEDDDREKRAAYSDDNAKANEFLYRRVDLEDAAEAHFLALDRAGEIGFGTFIVSATTPFQREDLARLRRDAPAVVRRYADYEAEYARRGWRMFPSLDRVYDNAKARAELGWRPRYDFAAVLDLLRQDKSPRSPLAEAIGAKGYHPERFEDGPYPVE